MRNVVFLHKNKDMTNNGFNNHEDNKQETQQKKDEQFMRKALAEAEAAGEAGEIPIGAVIVCNGRIVSRAHNLTETLCDVTAHAEMQAITAAENFMGGKYLTDCTLYVTVEPCPMCAGAIINARIPRVVFGAPDPKAGSCGSVTDLFALPYNHRPACEGGVLEEECAQLLRDFFRALRLAPPKPRWKPAVLPAQGGDHA